MIKVGDYVKIISEISLKPCKGEVSQIVGDVFVVKREFSRGRIYNGYYYEEELKLIKTENKNHPLTGIFK